MRVTAAQDALARPLRQAGIDVGGSLGYFPAPRSDGEGALFRGVAQPGRAPGSGPGGRRFESCLPDQPKAASSGTFPAGSRPFLLPSSFAARGMDHAPGAPGRPGELVDEARVGFARGAADPDRRRVSWTATAKRVVRDVNPLELLPRPAVRTGMLPTARVGMEVPLGHFRPEGESAVVRPNEAGRQRRRLGDPGRELVRRRGGERALDKPPGARDPRRWIGC